MQSHLVPIGIHLNNDSTWDCCVWAPGKKSVELLLLPESKAIKMQVDEFGYWKCNAGKLPEGTHYKFRVDGDDSFPDPASISQPEGVHGPSQFMSREFDWEDNNWKGLDKSEMIMYEIHTGTFSPERSFAGITKKLGYLKDLGINSIEIMPVAQFPGDRNWGYDGVFPFAVQNSYGGMKGLKQLVNEAHKAGIAVILDVVYNHTGPEGSYFHAFAPYFIDKYKTPWGPVANLDSEWSLGVRNYFIQNALMWLDEFRIDGLRMDAVHALFDNSAVHFMEELNTHVRKLEATTGRKKILIAELDLNNPRYINPKWKGGYGLDAQWVDEFHHALHSVLTGETTGYYSDFGDMEHVEKAFRDTYVYTGEYSKHRKRYFGVQVDNPYNQFVVFSQNHDHTGNRMLGERLTSLISFDGLKVAAAAVILSPYIPLLFMGEEYGEKNPFLYFVSHEDKELAEMVRKGRKEEFSYFNWEGDPPDPFSIETYENSSLKWNLDDKESAVLLKFYKELIRIRKEYPALTAVERSSMEVAPVKNNVLSYKRTHNEGELMIVINLGKEIAEYIIEWSDPKIILDSSDTRWLGNNEPSEQNDNRRTFINPLTVRIFGR